MCPQKVHSSKSCRFQTEPVRRPLPKSLQQAGIIDCGRDATPITANLFIRVFS